MRSKRRYLLTIPTKHVSGYLEESSVQIVLSAYSEEDALNLLATDECYLEDNGIVRNLCVGFVEDDIGFPDFTKVKIEEVYM